MVRVVVTVIVVSVVVLVEVVIVVEVAGNHFNFSLLHFEQETHSYVSVLPRLFPAGKTHLADLDYGDKKTPPTLLLTT